MLITILVTTGRQMLIYRRTENSAWSSILDYMLENNSEVAYCSVSDQDSKVTCTSKKENRL